MTVGHYDIQNRQKYSMYTKVWVSVFKMSELAFTCTKC